MESTNGKAYKTIIRPARLCGEERWATTKQQEKRIEMNKMRMLRWMCGVTRKDKIRNEHIYGTTTLASKCGETIELVWTCDEDIKKKIGQPQARWKDACQRDLKCTGLKWTERG